MNFEIRVSLGNAHDSFWTEHCQLFFELFEHDLSNLYTDTHSFGEFKACEKVVHIMNWVYISFEPIMLFKWGWM